MDLRAPLGGGGMRGGRGGWGMPFDDVAVWAWGEGRR